MDVPSKPEYSPRELDRRQDRAENLIESSPMGARLLEAAVDNGATVRVTRDVRRGSYLGDGRLEVNPEAFAQPNAGAGVLAHELGHWAIDHYGFLERMHRLPDGLGHLVNEVVAEALASTIAREAGFERGTTSVTRANGTMRTAQQAINEIVGTDYADYYGIPDSALTPAAQARAGRMAARLGAELAGIFSGELAWNSPTAPGARRP